MRSNMIRKTIPRFHKCAIYHVVSSKRRKTATEKSTRRTLNLRILDGFLRVNNRSLSCFFSKFFIPRVYSKLVGFCLDRRLAGAGAPASGRHKLWNNLRINYLRSKDGETAQTVVLTNSFAGATPALRLRLNAGKSRIQ